jgi:hypothetical protein
MSTVYIYHKIDDSIDSISKPLHSTNIWIDNINNEIDDPHPTIFITNIINIEHYDFIIQSLNESNQKSQFLKDENFITSSHSMMME